MSQALDNVFKLRNIVDVSSPRYGAHPTASAANNTAAFNAAIAETSAAGGGTITGPPGTYLWNKSGQQIFGRDYCVKLMPNVRLKFPGSEITVFKQADGQHADILTDPRDLVTGPSKNMGIEGFTVDGNYLNQNPESGIGIWFQNAEHVYFDDLMVRDVGSWAFRPQRVNYLTGGSYRANQPAVAGADGFHAIDCKFVTIDKIFIDAFGDDGFAIEALSTDCNDMAIGELVVSCPIGAALGGRGVFIFNDDAVNGVAGVQRNIYNVSMPNVVTRNCRDAGLVISAAEFYNIDVRQVDYGSRQAANLIMGATAGVGINGNLRNSKLDITSWNAREEGMLQTLANGVIDNCEINAQVHNPGDGKVAVSWKANRSRGRVLINYDPNNTKAAHSVGLDMFGSYNDVRVSCDKADQSLFVRPGAVFNDFHIGRLANAITRDIHVNAGADDNKIIGGSFTGSILDSGARTKYYMAPRAENYGKVTDTTNGSGNISIPHGLATTPKYAQVQLEGANTNEATLQQVDATNITVRVRNSTTNANLVSTSVTVHWSAQL